MDAKKEGRCDMFDQTNAGKERGMPIEDDDDDDGDFKIVASIYKIFEKRTLIFLRLMQSNKICHYALEIILRSLLFQSIFALKQKICK